MISHLRSNAVAYVALFVALSGGSFAVAALSGNEKKVVKKIATKRADKRITARAPSLAVLSAEEAARADQATSAASAGAVDGFEANGLVRTASASEANVADADGTALTTTITAPGPGFLTMIASLGIAYPAVGGEQIDCWLEIDEAEVPVSKRSVNVSGAVETDADCVTTITAPVAAGSRKVDFEVGGWTSASLSAASLSVIFTPFGATGGVPVP